MKNKKSSKIGVIKPARIIILIVFIMANTFAWFIYANKVNSNINVHVKGWNVTFEANQNQITNQVNVTVDDLYPGMTDYEYNISAYNNSEVTASLTYEIIEARILNDTYVTVEGRGSRGETVLSTDLLSADLEEMLAEDYPFTITLSTTGTLLNTNNGQQDFYLNVEWPYENNQDALDTTWGIAASNYKTSHPNSPSISLIVKLIITQNPS
jgi:hypothetical protein